MHWSKSENAEEVKKKIKEARARQAMKPRTVESRQIMSQKMRGNKNANGPKSEEHKRKISEAHKRIGSPWLMGKKRSPFSEEHRLKLSLKMRGDKHPFWKGGISVITEGERKSFEYRTWRKLVISKNKKECSICFATNVPLQVDHIKSFRFYPKLRYKLSNGRLLCSPCHRKTPNYGNREVRARDKGLSV